ncbi:transglutaminase-like domain-containing protein [Caloramator proteoclasticus]|uniref:Transglutaminase-like superfamily protein n=1 Tax=Caloramator proteoclasticus DSM 10124 TaxID=1121262 RepID=A0A1M4W9G4_9CLOT|nr:transglutaminase-like domain-containing protein [Caloramator proteoclasticus]SHE77847.1 Transglutaminase-like superfamily protein [Caloramator proteoclasticus DSM 10124]
MKNKPLEFIWYNFIQSILFIIIILNLQNLFKVKIFSYLLIFIYVFILVCLFISIRYRIFNLAIILLFIHPAIKNGVIELYKGFVPFVQSLIENGGLIETYNGYFIGLVTILFIPSYIVVYYLIKNKKSSIFLFVVGLFVFYGLYYYDLVNINRAVIYFTALLMLYGYNNFSKNTKTIDNNFKFQRGYFVRWLTLIIIFIMATNLFIKLLPFKNEPYIYIDELDFESGSIVNRVLNFEQKSFSLSMTGYQRDDKKLGGPIEDDNSKAFIVKSQSTLGEVHLRGTVKTTYNGSMWTKIDNNKLEIKNAVPDVNGLKEVNIFEGDKLKNINLEIIPKYINTKTIFTPLYLQSINISSNRQLSIDGEWEVLADKNLFSKDTYNLISIYYDYNNIEYLLKNSLNKKYDIRQFSIYLNVPNSVPQRVYSLTEEIVRQHKDKSNLVKAALIERYLKSNFQYDKNVSVVPDDRDFVDYFLFDEKRGYCTYYASAMAVMCRIANIPTRYVEGFTVNVTKGENIVYNKNAHAWVEVYTEELGWVTFDATPGHVSISDFLPQSLFLEEDKNGKEKEDKEIKPIEQKDKSKEKEDVKDKEQWDKKEAAKEKINNPIYVYVIAILILLYLCIYLFVFFKIDRLSKILNTIVFYGKLNGIKYSRDMTLREYIEKIEGQLQIDLNKIKDILDAYYYGGRKLSEHDFNLLKRKQKLISKKIRERGKIKYYFRKTIYILSQPFYYIFAYIRKNVI